MSNYSAETEGEITNEVPLWTRPPAPRRGWLFKRLQAYFHVTLSDWYYVRAVLRPFLVQNVCKAASTNKDREKVDAALEKLTPEKGHRWIADLKNAKHWKRDPQAWKKLQEKYGDDLISPLPRRLRRSSDYFWEQLLMAMYSVYHLIRPLMLYSDSDATKMGDDVVFVLLDDDC